MAIGSQVLEFLEKCTIVVHGLSLTLLRQIKRHSQRNRQRKHPRMSYTKGVEFYK